MTNENLLRCLKLHDVREHQCDQCRLDAPLLASFEVSAQGQSVNEACCHELCFHLGNEGKGTVWVDPEQIQFYPAGFEESTSRIPVGKNWLEGERIELAEQAQKAGRINFTLSKVNTDQEYNIIVYFQDDNGTSYRQKFVVGTRMQEEKPDTIETRYILTDDPEEI